MIEASTPGTAHNPDEQSSDRPCLLMLHGPNLNMLGRRDPQQYGTFTLSDIERTAAAAAKTRGFTLRSFQSNHEGDLIDRIHEAMDYCAGMLINPGALTHTSYALRDAIELCPVPVMEVHISDISKREDFRRHSVIRPVCCGQVAGHGLRGYDMAINQLADRILANMSDAPAQSCTDDPDVPHMEELPELRDRISSLDREILELFRARMGVARRVASAKAGTGGAIFDPVREDQVLELARQQLGGEDALRAENLMRSLMRLSRGAQYDILREQDGGFEIGRLIVSADTHSPEIGRLACQGSASSYSVRAAGLMYPHAEAVSTATFAEACSLVARAQADLAVLPLENTTAGTVDDVYDLLLEHNLTIRRSLSLSIQHRLLGCPGADLSQIREVLSHPQALAQCSDAILRNGWAVRESLNTAYAAQEVARMQNPAVAAIASDEAVSAYGLNILVSDMCNTPHNQTRFIAVGRQLVIEPDAERISLVLRLPHRSGSLTSTLALFSDRGLNLSKIQSRPDPLQPWSYLFYLDVECKAGAQQALSALYQLSVEMPYLRFLGWYREDQA